MTAARKDMDAVTISSKQVPFNWFEAIGQDEIAILDINIARILNYTALQVWTAQDARQLACTAANALEETA